MRPSLHRRRRDTALRLLLALILFRAYIPIGFMPADGTPFALQICPMGMAASMPAHHMHHDMGLGRHTHFEDCPFGSAPGVAPISQWVAFDPPAPVLSRPPVAPEPQRLGIGRQRTHQPRAPPPLA